MRHAVAKLGFVFLVGSGCSLIYNPNNIKAQAQRDAPVFEDAPIDVKPGPMDAPEMIIDANPASLALTSVEPASINEGQGDDGSRKAVLVVHGTNIIPGATIAITPKLGTDMPMVSSTNGAEVVAADHNFIAVPVTALVNTTCETGTLDLVVTVTQMGTSKTIPWKLSCLPQISQSTNLALSAGANVFSRITLTGSGTFTWSGTGPVIVRTTAGLSIAAKIDVSAMSATAGPGGNDGGASLGAGNGPGAGGPGNLTNGGTGAGYAMAIAGGGGMVGDPAISSYVTNQSSGGGGGDGTTGGGGGGTVELSAGGTLVAGAIDSKGAAGGGGTTGGGGGAGGTIVLRGGSSAMLNGNLNATGGAGGGSLTAPGTAGSPGRIRVDAPAATTGSGTANPPLHGGLMFDPVNTYVTQMPSTGIVPLTLHGTVNDRFDLYTLQGGSIKDEVDNLPLTANPTTVPTQLHWGLNTVCAVPHVTPQLVPSTAPESATCIDVAFLP